MFVTQTSASHEACMLRLQCLRTGPRSCGAISVPIKLFRINAFVMFAPASKSAGLGSPIFVSHDLVTTVERCLVLIERYFTQDNMRLVTCKQASPPQSALFPVLSCLLCPNMPRVIDTSEGMQSSRAHRPHPHVSTQCCFQTMHRSLTRLLQTLAAFLHQTQTALCFA